MCEVCKMKLYLVLFAVFVNIHSICVTLFAEHSRIVSSSKSFLSAALNRIIFIVPNLHKTPAAMLKARELLRQFVNNLLFFLKTKAT